MNNFDALPDINAEDYQAFETIDSAKTSSFRVDRNPLKSTQAFKQKLPEQFSTVEKIASDLARNGSNKLGYFSNLFLEAKAGRMSKAQIIKALDLRFNAEFKHAAFKLSIQLDEANKAVFFEYLKRDAAQRNALAEALRMAEQAIAETIFVASAEAMEIRKKWKDRIKQLYNSGLINEAEARHRLALADHEAEKLEQNAINMADIQYASLLDKAQYALQVPINELLKKTDDD